MTRAVTRVKGMVVAATLTIAVAAMGVGPAQAEKGGNSANGHLCQQGSWQDLVTETGQGFANAEECVSHAARGGTPRTLTSLERWQAICEDAGGLVTTGPTQWHCGGFGQAVSSEDVAALVALCEDAGGTSFVHVERDNVDFVDCNF
jgi:hypothetical protein